MSLYLFINSAVLRHNCFGHWDCSGQVDIKELRLQECGWGMCGEKTNDT